MDKISLILRLQNDMYLIKQDKVQSDWCLGIMTDKTVKY